MRTIKFTTITFLLILAITQGFKTGTKTSTGVANFLADAEKMNIDTSPWIQSCLTTATDATTASAQISSHEASRELMSCIGNILGSNLSQIINLRSSLQSSLTTLTTWLENSKIDGAVTGHTKTEEELLSFVDMFDNVVLLLHSSQMAPIPHDLDRVGRQMFLGFANNDFECSQIKSVFDSIYDTYDFGFYYPHDYQRASYDDIRNWIIYAIENRPDNSCDCTFKGSYRWGLNIQC